MKPAGFTARVSFSPPPALVPFQIFLLHSYMLDTIVKKFVGTKNERELKKIQPLVAAINDLEPRISSLSDEQLAAKTTEFRKRFENGESLDDLLSKHLRSSEKPANAR